MAKIDIAFFGRLSDQMGASVSFDWRAETGSISDLRKTLAREHENDDLLLPTIRAVINDAIVADDTIVKPGDSVAFLSPLSGG